MFRNREVRVKLAKTPKNKKTEDTAPAQEETESESFQEIAEITKDLVTHTALVVGGVFAAVKVLSAASEIAVKRTPSKDKE